MMSKPKARRTSNGSSSAGSGTKRSSPSTPRNIVTVCNGTASLPFKKRKLATSESSSNNSNNNTPSSLSRKCFSVGKLPAVALMDILQNEELCVAYGLNEKPGRSTGSVPSEEEFDDGDYLLDEVVEEEEEMEDSLINFEQMADERKVVMRKNNIIMITRCVSTNENQPQARKRSLGNSCNGKRSRRRY